MAQTGFTPIQIYSSSTAAAAPAAGNLTNSTLGAELAINITDGKLFYKDNANVVQVIGWKTVPTTAGGTGLTSYTAGDLLYYATGTALSKLGIGAVNTVLTSSGTAPQWSTGLALTSASSIEVTDNVNEALRITQLGTGNALLVEDSTNPDASPFVINASGFQINGYTTTIGNPSYTDTQTTAKVQLHGTTIGTAMQTTFNWGTGATSAAGLVLAKSKSGTIGTRGVVSEGDTLGAVSAVGDDGANFVTAANILVQVDGTPGTNDMPGRLVFSTTADGASSPTEAMRIGSDGITRFGNTGVTNQNTLQIAPTTGSDVTIRTNRTGIGVSHVPLYLQAGTADPVQISTTGGLTVPRTTVTSPAAGDGNVFSGTYTPSLTNTTNITSSFAFTFSYMRVGNVVTVQGRVTIVPASAAACELNIALPIASNLALESLSGCVGPTSVYTVGICDGNATLDTARITFLAPATTSRQWPVSFTYRVI